MQAPFPFWFLWRTRKKPEVPNITSTCRCVLGRLHHNSVTRSSGRMQPVCHRAITQPAGTGWHGARADRSEHGSSSNETRCPGFPGQRFSICIRWPTLSASSLSHTDPERLCPCTVESFCEDAFMAGQIADKRFGLTPKLFGSNWTRLSPSRIRPHRFGLMSC